MTQVPAFHSTRQGETKYHNNNECKEGNNIESYNLAQGTGNLRLCEHCAQLNSEGR
jgi:hypothetical protein